MDGEFPLSHPYPYFYTDAVTHAHTYGDTNQHPHINSNTDARWANTNPNSYAISPSQCSLRGTGGSG